MYDDRLTIGRISYHLQFRLVVDPRVLVFEAGGRSLGTKLDSRAWAPLAPLPRGWRWAARPVPLSDYGAARGQKKWVVSDHARFEGTTAFASNPVWRQASEVVCQLVLASEAFERGHGRDDLRAAIDAVYEECLPELLEAGVAGELSGTAPNPAVRERLRLELDDGRRAIAPTRKLMGLAVGLWALMRTREQAPDPYADLLDHLAASAGDDLVGRVHLLLDGWVSRGKQTGGLTWPFLRTLLTEPAWGLVLAQNLPGTGALAARGMLRFDAEGLGVLSIKDLERLKKAGVDTPFASVWAGQGPPSPVSDELRRFCLLDEIQRFVAAHAFGDGKPPLGLDHVALPLAHLRQTVAPRRIEVEPGGLGALRTEGGRYPLRVRTVPWARKKHVEVHDCRHLHQLGQDWAGLCELALALGTSLLERIVADDPLLKQRKREALDAQLAGQVSYLYRNFQRPWWVAGYDGRVSKGMGRAS